MSDNLQSNVGTSKRIDRLEKEVESLFSLVEKNMEATGRITDFLYKILPKKNDK